MSFLVDPSANSFITCWAVQCDSSKFELSQGLLVILVVLKHILTATLAQIFRFLWFMPSLGVRCPCIKESWFTIYRNSGGQLSSRIHFLLISVKIFLVWRSTENKPNFCYVPHFKRYQNSCQKFYINPIPTLYGLNQPI